MIRLLRALFASPDAERDPMEWATRFMAHLGLGCVVWLILAELAGPAGACLICGGAYAAFEAAQWQGGRRMAFDGLLDFVAFAFALTGLFAVAHQQGQAGMACGLAALAVVWAGVWRRSR